MNAKASIFSQMPLDQAAGVRPGICRSCGQAIAVPAAARFCPRCGTSLRAAGVSGAGGAVVEADAIDRLAAIREAEQALPPPFIAIDDADDNDAALPPFAHLASQMADEHASALKPPPLPSVPPPLPRNFHSDVLVAYATALFRLGWRYERGLGAPRNVAEAIRCYYKSARLGNRSAATRLDSSSRFPT